MTEEAQKRRDAERALLQTNEGGRGDGQFNGPEDLALYTRCVVRAPLPRTPTGYDNNYPSDITVWLNGFEIGTLMLFGLNPTLVPGILNGSGVNGTGASDESKNERTALKSANTVRYLSHRSRVKEP